MSAIHIVLRIYTYVKDLHDLSTAKAAKIAIKSSKTARNTTKISRNPAKTVSKSYFNEYKTISLAFTDSTFFRSFYGFRGFCRFRGFHGPNIVEVLSTIGNTKKKQVQGCVNSIQVLIGFYSIY